MVALQAGLILRILRTCCPGNRGRKNVGMVTYGGVAFFTVGGVGVGRLLPLPYTSIKRPSAPPTHLPGGADGQEGVGPAGEHSLPVDQQHADVVLTLRLQGAVSTGITGLGLAASRRSGIGC